MNFKIITAVTILRFMYTSSYKLLMYTRIMCVCVCVMYVVYKLLKVHRHLYYSTGEYVCYIDITKLKTGSFFMFVIRTLQGCA